MMKRQKRKVKQAFNYTNNIQDEKVAIEATTKCCSDYNLSSAQGIGNQCCEYDGCCIGA